MKKNIEACLVIKYLLIFIGLDKQTPVHKTYDNFLISKKEGNDQESIQSSTTPGPGYQWGK